MRTIDEMLQKQMEDEDFKRAYEEVQKEINEFKISENSKKVSDTRLKDKFNA